MMVKHPVLVPEPVQLEVGSGSWTLPDSGRVIELIEDGDVSCMLAHRIVDAIHEATGFTWSYAKGESWGGSIRLEVDQRLRPQEYRLDISAGGDTASPCATVSGGDLDGVRHGVQTLDQVILGNAPVLPELHIEDTPRYPVRGYSLDITRGRVPTLDWLKRWACLLARYKYNQLQLYVEHTVAFDRLNEGWRGVGALQPSEIIEFDEYCADLGIELVPSISTFGHHYMNLRTRTFRELGEFPEDADRPYSFVERQEHHTLNVTDPRSFAFSTRLIDATMDLFRSNTVNICADETFDLGRGRSRQAVANPDVATMYAQYVERLCHHVSEHGRSVQLWGDIAVSMPEILGMLPKDVTLLNWLYSPDVGEDKVRLVAQAGARQYVCPAVQTWNGFLPKIDDAWSNISKLSKFGVQYQAAGILVTDWGDYGHVNDPRMSIPGMLYGAECSWSPVPRPQGELNTAISQVAYDDPTGTVVDSLARAAHCCFFRWEDLVDYIELDDGSGHLNEDVLGAIRWKLPEDMRTSAGAAGLAEVRAAFLRELMTALSAGGVNAWNASLDEIAAALGTALSGTGHAGDGVLESTTLAIHGQRIFNDIGVLLCVRHDLDDMPSNSVAQQVATGLELWFETYCRVWRTVSRESELRHIADVVWRCADILRS